MKNFLSLLVITAGLVACNNSADPTQRQKDSLDSIARDKKENVDSTNKASKDMLDSASRELKEGVDSINEAKKRALDTAQNRK